MTIIEFRKNSKHFYEGQAEQKLQLFECLFNSHVDRSIHKNISNFRFLNLILKNKIETYLVFLYSFVSILSNLESTVPQKFCCRIFDFQKTIATRHSLQTEWTYFPCMMRCWSHVTWRGTPNPSNPYTWNWFSPILTSKTQ